MSTELGPQRRRLPAVVEQGAATLFGGVAALRGRRGLHPRGVSFAGRAEFHDAGAALASSSEVGVEARLSRGAGFPHPIPDFNGIAIRFLDAHGPDQHQDLLLTTAGGPPGLRHLIAPMPYLGSSGYSTVLPYRTPNGERRVFRCDPLPVRTLADAASAPPCIEILVAAPLGPWAPAASVVLTSVLLPDAPLRFDPWNTSPDLIPSGVLNRLRAPAYAGSRAATPLERR